VKASTDHGLLIGDANFDGDYYESHLYLDGLPSWAVALSREERFQTQFIDDVAWQPKLEVPISTREHVSLTNRETVPEAVER